MDSSSAPLFLAFATLFAFLLSSAGSLQEKDANGLSSKHLKKGLSSNEQFRFPNDQISVNDRISNNERKRKKRIILGINLDNDTGVYPVVHYQGAFAPPFWCKHELLRVSYLFPSLAITPDPIRLIDDDYHAHEYFEHVFKYCPYPKTSFHYCGLTVLTPSVVQTSCRCIARTKDLPNGIWKQMVPYNDFEDMKFIHTNFVSWEDYKTPYVSARFMVHEKCRQIYDMPYTYDFGLVFLKFPIPTPDFFGAPIFPVADIIKQWRYILSNEIVCLHIGWGLQGDPTESYVDSPPLPPAPIRLQHTWRATISYLGCIDIMYQMDGFNKAQRQPSFKFKEYYTFTCHEWFGRRRGHLAPGDAGSPVTCMDDVFMGFNGWIFETNENSTAKKQLAGDNTIINTPYENSADYRKAFLGVVWQLTKERDYPVFSDYLPIPWEKKLKDEYLSEIIRLPSGGKRREILPELFALAVLWIFL